MEAKKNKANTLDLAVFRRKTTAMASGLDLQIEEASSNSGQFNSIHSQSLRNV